MDTHKSVIVQVLGTPCAILPLNCNSNICQKKKETCFCQKMSRGSRERKFKKYLKLTLINCNGLVWKQEVAQITYVRK
jgi:hypothetical protein